MFCLANIANILVIVSSSVCKNHFDVAKIIIDSGIVRRSRFIRCPLNTVHASVANSTTAVNSRCCTLVLTFSAYDNVQTVGGHDSPDDVQDQ